jgi:two-component system, OmpR family, sensor histidine kinase QseC
MNSIRRLMLVSLIVTVTLVTIVAAAFSYRTGLQEAGEMFDAKLAHSARVLMSLVDASLQDLAQREPGEPLVIEVWHGDAHGEGAALAFPTGHAYETKLAFQVRDANGRLLLRSESGPSQPLAPLRPGYVDRDIDGQRWRSFSLRSRGGLWYQASEVSDIRAEIAEEIAFGTLLPLLLALPVLAALVWCIVTWSLRDLQRISAEIGERAAERMTPLRIERVPVEIERLVSAVNSLLARLQTALARERRFTADAAHELRTPIAALKVHADNLRGARDAAEAEESRQQLDRGIERIERLVAQLLSLNRVEPDTPMLAPVTIDLDAIVRQQAEALQPMARQRRIDLDLRSLPTPLLGDGPALESLVRNLLDNALRYTPEGGRVHVALEHGEGIARLDVEDSGPGIAPEARQRVFERFHREPGNGVEGSGLGLSIVREVLALHRGAVQLDDSPELGGLRVRVVLPLSERGPQNVDRAGGGRMRRV